MNTRPPCLSRLSREHPPALFELSVDDLKEIGALESYIDESQCVLVFLSRGYFESRNCQREVVATVEKSKPLVPLWEKDQGHGGAPVSELRARCQEDLRTAVFDAHEVITWHRYGQRDPSLCCRRRATTASCMPFAPRS